MKNLILALLLFLPVSAWAAGCGSTAYNSFTGKLDCIGTAASGTVTSVSVTTANGVSGSVATATTTPAISITLGAITPTTVNGLTVTTSTGTLTVANAKTLTNSNTLTLTATDGSTLAIGAGGTLGSNAYTSTAYLPLAGGTMVGNLLFTDATYDIGASGATRPRDFYLSRNSVIGGAETVTGLISGGTLNIASSKFTVASTGDLNAAINSASNLGLTIYNAGAGLALFNLGVDSTHAFQMYVAGNVGVLATSSNNLPLDLEGSYTKFTPGSTPTAEMHINQFQFATTAGISFGALNGTQTTGISYCAAGVVCIGTGAVGSTAGTLTGTNLRAVAVAVASLPACAAGTQGTTATVNDSNAASFTVGIGAIVAAGGSTVVPVFCDATNWRIG